MLLSIIAIISPITSGRYDLAIMLPKEDRDADEIFFSTGVLIVLVSVFIYLSVVLLYRYTSIVNSLDSIMYWLVLFPLCLVFNSFIELIVQEKIRAKKFKTVAISKIIQGATASLIPIFFFYWNEKDNWLIVGVASGLAISFLFLAKNTKFRLISVKKIKNTLKKYKEYPIYLLPTELLNTGSSHALIFLIAVFFDPTVAGLYFMTQRVIMSPISMISTSIGKVFYQKFSETIKTDIKRSKKVLLGTWRVLFFVGLLPFCGVFFYGEFIFSFIFGESWSKAGEMASVLTLIFYAKFVSSSTSTAFLTLGLLKYSLYFGIYSLITRFFSLVIGVVSNDIIIFIKIMTVTEMTQILVYNYIIWNTLCAKKNPM